MCQIFWCPRDVPSLDILWEANRANSHGIGFAWVEQGRVNWSKGWDEKKFNEATAEFLTKPFPKAIHFRFATHGGGGMDMTHPFNVTRLSRPDLTGRSSSVLFHNGVWTDYDQHVLSGVIAGTIPKKALNYELSDSRGMALLAGNFGERILDLMDLTGEKVLIMHGDGTSVRYGTWYQDGEKDEDEWYAWVNNRGGVVEREDTGWYHSNMHLSLESKKRYKARMEAKGKSSGGTQTSSSGTQTSSAHSVLPKGSYLSSDYEEVQAHLKTWEGHNA